MYRLCAAGLAALFALLWPVICSADGVTLRSAGGGLELQGRLLSFDGSYYKIDTIYGVLTLNGDGLRCEGKACDAAVRGPARLRISGAAETGTELMPALVEAYARSNDLSIEKVVEDDTHFRYRLANDAGAVVLELPFRVSTAAEGFADLLASEADMAMAFRPITDAENKRSLEAGLGNLRATEQVIALDALVPIVSPQSEVQSIPVDALAGYFSGDLTSWSSAGGPDATVRLYLGEAGSGIARQVQAQIMKDRTLAANIRRFQDNQTLADAVARDPHALGIGVLSEAGNAVPLALSGNCGLAVSANAKSLKLGAYPLAQAHRIYVPRGLLPAVARDFLEFLSSDSARRTIERLGHIPPGIQRLDAGDADNAGLIQLSLVFRFEAGGTSLDPLSRRALPELINWIEANRPERVVFIGHSDTTGPEQPNLILSARRSLAVLDQVRSGVDQEIWQGIRATSRGEGETRPMVCDDTQTGQHLNRRVEVWVSYSNPSD